jgi:hypothetical protein
MLSAGDSRGRVVGIISANPGYTGRDVVGALRSSYVQDGLVDPGFEAAKAEVRSLIGAGIIGPVRRRGPTIVEECDLSPPEQCREFQDYLKEWGITKIGDGHFLVGSGMDREAATARLCDRAGDMLMATEAMPTAVVPDGSNLHFANSYGVFEIKSVTG